MNPMLNWGRMTMDGIPHCDVNGAVAVAAEDWYAYWQSRGEAYAALGQEASARGHATTAGQLTWLAALCFQYAHYLWAQDPVRRAEGQRRKVELYDRAAPDLNPPAQRCNVPIGDLEIPGYLRLPDRHQPTRRVPCAVLLGGLESTKEESHLFENELLQRGIATYAFDGPGQGELLESVKLSPDFERYTTTVLDALISHDELDGDRIAVVGRSLGGHYALKSAASDARFAACVSWGGFFDMSDFDSRGPLSKSVYRLATGAPDLAETAAIVRASLTCEHVIDGLRCPTYHLHGALDAISLQQVDRLRERAVNAPLTIVVEPEGDHCCHNLGPRIRLAMIDWLSAQLQPDVEQRP